MLSAGSGGFSCFADDCPSDFGPRLEPSPDRCSGAGFRLDGPTDSLLAPAPVRWPDARLEDERSSEDPRPEAPALGSKSSPYLRL